MRRTVSVILGLVLLVGAAATVGAAEKSYKKPLETVWDAAVKACRDAELVVLDSDREEHELLVRTKSWYSSKKGDRIRITMSGDHMSARLQVAVEDPERAEATAKHIERFLAALDERLD